MEAHSRDTYPSLGRPKEVSIVTIYLKDKQELAKQKGWKGVGSTSDRENRNKWEGSETTTEPFAGKVQGGARRATRPVCG